MAMQRKLWSVNAPATELDIDRRMLAKWLEGSPAATEKKIGSRIEKHRHLADELEHFSNPLSPDGDVLVLTAERARLAKEQADKTAMENARLRGELVPVSAVRELLEKVLSAFKARVLSIPAKIAPLLLRLKSAAEARELVDSHLYDALSELSWLDAAELKKDGRMPGDG